MRSPTIRMACRLSGCWLVNLTVLATLGNAAQPPMPLDPLQQMPDHESGKLQEIVAGLVRASLPEHYTNDKDWGHQKRVYAGVKISREGWKLETKRRWREVNHGVWTRYQIDLVDPATQLTIQLEDLSWQSDGSAKFRLTVSGMVHCFARRSRWNYGVQWWSFGVDAHARLAITIVGTIGMRLDYVNIPPDVVFTPEVTEAKIDVARFEVDRISDIGGDVAEGIGKALESLLRDAIVKRQQEKLVDKMNRQIDRKKDSLRISMSDWMSKLLATEPNASP